LKKILFLYVEDLGIPSLKANSCLSRKRRRTPFVGIFGRWKYQVAPTER
jgi:hypothetical protein